MKLDIMYEDAYRWNVRCSATACGNFVTVAKSWTDHLGQKHTRTEPHEVRCVVHPPAPKKEKS